MARKRPAARSASIRPRSRSVSSPSSASPRRRRAPASASCWRRWSSAPRPWAALPSVSIVSPPIWWGRNPFARSSRFPRPRREPAPSRMRPRPWTRANSGTWASASSKDPGQRDRRHPRHPPRHHPAPPPSPGPPRPPRRAPEAPGVSVRGEGDLAGPRRDPAGGGDADPAGGEGGARPDRDAPRAALPGRGGHPFRAPHGGRRARDESQEFSLRRYRGALAAQAHQPEDGQPEALPRRRPPPRPRHRHRPRGDGQVLSRGGYGRVRPHEARGVAYHPHPARRGGG